MKKTNSKKLYKKSKGLSKSIQAFRKTVQSTANKYALWKKGDSILIGVSGGADSTALFYFFLSLQKKYDLKLSVAHVNYHLRDKESDLDEKYVRKLCKNNTIPCFIFHSHTTKRDESTLRNIRLSFFKKLLKNHSFDAIALAHHQDDQAETLLFRLLRGSGLYGMQAMRPKNPPFIRPFLFTSREEIHAYLKKNNISFRYDASNDDPRYTRNYLRHHILPLLQKNVQPKIASLLSQTALLCAEDEAQLQDLLSQTFSYTKTSHSISFSLKKWQSLSLSLQRRALILCINENIPETNRALLSFARIEEIRNTLSQNKPKKQKISFSPLILERSGDTVTLFYQKSFY
jgi:tRNA(Ile)-lysidine synthase